jgi:hypothetical protein
LVKPCWAMARVGRTRAAAAGSRVGPAANLPACPAKAPGGRA